MIRHPVDGFKITNYRTFTAAENVDVNAAAHLLRDDMPTIAGSRKTVWPPLCASMGAWNEQLVVDRAEILHTEQTRWKQHEKCYVQNILMICLRLRSARETWVSGARWRLCERFCVDTAVDLAKTIDHLHEKT